MNANEFCTFLRDLQTHPYSWPNRYFAWKKPDDTLFMVATNSMQYNTIMKYQFESWCQDYTAHFVDINPKVIHERGNKVYDPVEELVSEVSNYAYVGSWDDPDFFMETETGPVRSHGRWELAKAQILAPEKKPSLSEQILSAAAQASSQATDGISPTKKTEIEI